MYKHCYHCGIKLPDIIHFPYQCVCCHQFLYFNPTPVGVAILPVGEGLLVIQRGLTDGYQKWALPGGYLERNETWQTGILRELHEETGINLDKNTPIILFDVISDQKGNLLIFGQLPPINYEDIPEVKKNNEVVGIKVIYKPETLAFSIHENIVKRYFDKN